MLDDSHITALQELQGIADRSSGIERGRSPESAYFLKIWCGRFTFVQKCVHMLGFW